MLEVVSLNSGLASTPGACPLAQILLPWFPRLFIHEFHRHLLSTYSVPNKADTVPVLQGLMG